MARVTERKPRRQGLALVELTAQLGWVARQGMVAAPGAVATYVLLQLLVAVSPAASIRVTQHLLNLAIAIAGRRGAGYRVLVPWLGLLAATLLLTGYGILNRLNRPILQRLGQRMEYALVNLRLATIARLPLRYFDESATYDRLERAARADRSSADLLTTATNALRYVVEATTVALLFGAVFRWLPIALLLAEVVQALVRAEVSRRYMRATFRHTEDERRVAYLGDLLTGRAEQKELRTFALHGVLAARWNALRGRLRAATLRENRRSHLLEIPAQSFSLTLHVAVIFILAASLAQHRITTGAFIALFGAVAELGSTVTQVLHAIGGLQKRATEVGYLRDFLAAGGAGTVATAQRANEKPFPVRLVDGIRCEEVWFTYAQGARPVLSGVTLTLRPGERVALVGANGAGKSTLVKCLLGLYQPDSGRITADGLDYREIGVTSLRRNVCAAYQDFFNFEFTAAESIGIGDVGRIQDPAAVAAAARLGGAAEVVARLPLGYNTPLGHVLDEGTGLSGGEWQRFATSRALMRRPQLLILDEPVAALDPQAEAELYARFAEASSDATVLLISHRLGCARLADRILVLSGGRIAEDGSHDSLVARGGLYARLWGDQAQWYR